MEKQKKIAIIGTVGLPANYGGFETLAEHLVEDLGKEYKMSVYCSGKKYKKPERKKYFKRARLFYIPLKANGIQSILYDTISILHALLYADVLLILGVAGAWTLPFIKFFTKKKIIISIDGIEWKRDKWPLIAKLFLWWSEGLAVKYSHIDISDNESIQDYTAKRYKSLSRVIEYGGDHTIKIKPSDRDLKCYPLLKKNYAFKVCRIEPENNVEMIIEAFKNFNGIHLAIVGNWNNSEYGIRLKQKFKDQKHIHLMDPIYDQRTLDVLRGNAYLYLHGHSAGGTNPSLVEAMHLELPIFCFDVTYNRTTTQNQAYYFDSTNTLVNLIAETKYQELLELGEKMHSIAKKRYTWSRIAKQYAFMFQEVLTNPEKNNVRPKFPVPLREKYTEEGYAHLRTQKLFYD